MAQTQLRAPSTVFVNANKAVADQGGGNSLISSSANYGSINALKSRLSTLNASYYTVAKLDQMSVNDMVWALRSMEDKGTICDYMPTSTA